MATYTDLAGALPSPLTLEFKTWYRELLAARVAEIDLPRSRTIYFSSSGDDGTGLGTIGAPWKTVSKANTEIAASSGDLKVLFRQGDEFASTVGLTVAKANVTLGAYNGGTNSTIGKPPLIHCFTNSVASGSAAWTLDNNGSATEGDTYSLSQATAVGYLREKTGPLNLANDITRLDPYRFFDTLAEVRVNPLSWTWIDADDKIYVNCGDGVDPNNKSWEYSFRTVAAQNGLLIDAVTGCVVDGLRFDGWGATFDPTATSQFYGIKISGQFAGKNCLVRNCEAYYNGLHNIGNNTNSGGYITWINCKAGYTTVPTSGAWGSQPYIWYSDTTTTLEAIAHNCQARFGVLPYSTYGRYKYDTSGFYSHDSAGTSSPALMILWGCSEVAEYWRNNWTSCYGGVAINYLAGTDSDLSTFRTFVFDHRTEMQGGKVAFSPKIFYGNCLWKYNFPSSDTGFDFFGTNPVSGVAVNNIILFNDLAINSQRALSTNNASNSLRFWHGSIVVDGTSDDPGSGVKGFGLSAVDMTPTTFDFCNCLFVKLGTKGFVSRANGSSKIRYIAGYALQPDNALNGFNYSDHFIDLKSPINPFAVVTGDPIVGAGINLGLEYDFNWNGRPETPSIGAVEGNPTAPIGNLDIYNDILFDDKTRRALAVALGSKVAADQIIAKLTNPATMNALEEALLEVALADPAYAAQVQARISP